MATLDLTGQYRRDLGWKLTRSGKRAQQRFYLGRDKNMAQVIETRLEALWSALEEYFADERKGESPLWEEWSLEIAGAITEGKMVIAPPHPPAALVALFPDEPDLALAGWLDILQAHFSGVIGFSGQTFSGSLGGYRGRGEFDKPKPVHRGHTLHSAIDALYRIPASSSPDGRKHRVPDRQEAGRACGSLETPPSRLSSVRPHGEED